jgi:hypothetical protein
MNAKELLQYFDDTTAYMRQMIIDKNHDYAGSSENAFANFEAVETFQIDALAGLITRMSDKLMRLANFRMQGTLKVVDEKAEDTLVDLANYAILTAAFLESRRRQQPGVIHEPIHEDTDFGLDETYDEFDRKQKGAVADGKKKRGPYRKNAGGRKPVVVQQRGKLLSKKTHNKKR